MTKNSPTFHIVLIVVGLALAVLGTYILVKPGVAFERTFPFDGMEPPLLSNYPPCEEELTDDGVETPFVGIDEGIYDYHTAFKKCKYKKHFERPRDSQIQDSGPRRSDR